MKYKTLKQYHCKDCGVPIAFRTALYRGGRCKVCSRKGKLNPNYKKGITIEKHYCKEKDCNNVITLNGKLYGNGRCKKCSSRRANNPFWRGGITSLTVLIRTSVQCKEWVKSVFQRDRYICQECKNGGKLNAHHIIPFSKILDDFLKHYNQFSPLEDKETLARLSISYEPFWDIENGLTLCVECHKFIRGKLWVQ